MRISAHMLHRPSPATWSKALSPSHRVFIRLITEKWSLESAMIRFGTRGWPSHAEFVVVDGGGRPVTTLGSRLQGGVDSRPYDYCKPTHEEWFDAPHIGDAYEYGLTLKGAGYDWRDILGMATNTDWHTDGFWICSEFVAACGEKEIIKISPRAKNLPDTNFLNSSTPWFSTVMPVRRITPRDFLLPNCFTLFRRVE